MVIHVVSTFQRQERATDGAYSTGTIPQPIEFPAFPGSPRDAAIYPPQPRPEGFRHAGKAGRQPCPAGLRQGCRPVVPDPASSDEASAHVDGDPGRPAVGPVAGPGIEVS